MRSLTTPEWYDESGSLVKGMGFTGEKMPNAALVTDSNSEPHFLELNDITVGEADHATNADHATEATYIKNSSTNIGNNESPVYIKNGEALQCSARYLHNIHAVAKRSNTPRIDIVFSFIGRTSSEITNYNALLSVADLGYECPCNGIYTPTQESTRCLASSIRVDYSGADIGVKISYIRITNNAGTAGVNMPSTEVMDTISDWTFVDTVIKIR